MFTEPQRAYLQQVARTTQIIAIAMIVGIAVFGVVMVFILDLGDREPIETPFISMFAVAMGVASFFVAPLGSQFISAGMRKSLAAGNSIRLGGSSAIPEETGQVGELAHIYQIEQIIHRAVLEGAAFMNLAVFLVESQPMCPVIALCLLLAMFFRFPTYNHLENWVGKEMTAIEQLRSFEE